MINEYDSQSAEIQRGLLIQLFDKLTNKQKRLFHLTYGNIYNMDEKEMRTAYFHCKRTLKWKR